MSTGLIFLELLDPISQVAKRIARQEFSTIGVYWTNYLLPQPVVEVWIAPNYGAADPITTGGNTLNYYINHPLVTKVALSPIIDQGSNVSDWLSTIAVLKSQAIPPSANQLLDLFIGVGSVSGVAYKNTGVGIVNNIIYNMGLSSAFTKTNDASIHYKDSFGDADSNTLYKSNILSTYARSFRSQIPAGDVNFLMATYLLPNAVFEPLVYQEVPPKTGVDESLNNILVNFNSVISSLSTAFVTRLCDNNVYNYEFVEAVIRAFKDVQREEQQSRKIYNAMVKQLSYGGSDLGMLWNERNISFNELENDVNQFNDANDVASMLTQQTLAPNVDLEKPFLSFDVHVNVDNRPSVNQLLLKNLSDFVVNTNKVLETRKRCKEIHWGELINNLNLVLLQAGLPVINVPDRDPVDALVTFEQCHDLNLELLSGRHVTITGSSGDEKQLKDLNLEELENLNCILDVMASSDKRFDSVRFLVTKLLASK